MLYVVVEELIPEASEGEHSNIGTIGFAIGFALTAPSFNCCVIWVMWLA